MVTSESLTAGLVSSSVASVPGTSEVLWGGFVTYQNQAKEKILGVDDRILTDHGAVSRQTAEAMAVGALFVSGCSISVSVTGIAGPSGGTTTTPIGTVWVSVAFASVSGNPPDVKSTVLSLTGNRNCIRRKAARNALLFILDCLDSK